MKKALMVTFLLVGALAFIAPADAWAGWCPGGGGGSSPGGRGAAGGAGGCGGGGITPTKPMSSTWMPSTDAYGGSVSWVNSSGKPAPKTTGDDSKKTDELFEVQKARQEMKPILVFFAKSRDVLNYGKKSRDREVEATTHYEKEIFRRYAITQLAGEFISIKVDTRKADRKLMAKSYYVRRAPVVVILDLYGNTIYRLSSPKLSYRQLAKVMETAIKKVEKEVARLAKSKEAGPIVERAKVRLAEIEMRDTNAKALDLCYKKQWEKAEKLFRQVLDRREDNQYKAKAQAGLKEIEAGKLFAQGEYLYRKKRYQQARDTLGQVLNIKESQYFKQMAADLIRKINKKIG